MLGNQPIWCTGTAWTIGGGWHELPGMQAYEFIAKEFYVTRPRSAQADLALDSEIPGAGTEPPPASEPARTAAPTADSAFLLRCGTELAMPLPSPAWPQILRCYFSLTYTLLSQVLLHLEPS